MTTSVTDSRAMQKPLPSEIDVCGLTHRGRVRSENADHFLIASFHRAMQVQNSSLPHSAFSALSADSRGYVFLVADGVGAFHGQDVADWRFAIGFFWFDASATIPMFVEFVG